MFVLKYNYFGIMNYELGIIKNKSLKFFFRSVCSALFSSGGNHPLDDNFKKIQIKI
jgi:hypothetical protein